METLARVIREHPIAFLAYVGVMAFIIARLVHLLRQTWALARTPRDRWAAATLGSLLSLAFCGLCTFLFLSLFA